MYDVNGFPPTRMSTRRSASRRTTSTRFGDDWAPATPAAAAASIATPHVRTSHLSSRMNVVRMNLISESANVLERSVDRSATFPARRQAGEHAAHVRERTLHSWQRIVCVDLVLQIHVSAIL